MTEKDFKKLNRKQLLELLLKQTERADRMHLALQQAEDKLRDRKLTEQEAGSIAEASLRLNGVFEAAEAAASQYLDNIKALSANQNAILQRKELEAQRKVEEMLQEAKAHCAQMEAECEKRCALQDAECEKRCAQREAAAQQRLKDISVQLEQMFRQKKALDDIFSSYAAKQDYEE